MNRIRSFVLAAAAIGLALQTSSCVTTDSQSVEAEKVPLHVRQVTAALAQRLQGAAPNAGLKVSGLDSVRPVALLSDFTVVRTGLDSLTLPTTPNGDHALGGRLVFIDSVGRTAQIGIDAEYAVTGAAVTVKNLALVPLYSDTPRTEAFFIEASKMKNMPNNSYAAAYRYIVENAVPMGNRAKVPAGKRDYGIFVFSKDQIEPGGKLQLLLSDDQHGASGFEGRTRYRSFDGWMMAVAMGNFNLSPDSSFFVKVVATAAGENQKPRLIKTYSNIPAP